VDYDKLGSNAKSGAEKLGSGIGSVFSALFKGFAKVIGALIAVSSAIMLGVVVVFFISLLFTSSLKSSMWHPWVGGFNYTDTPLWIMGTAAFFAIAIPLFIIFLLGLKILVDNLKPIGNITKFTLLAIWIISFIGIIYIGISQATEINEEGKTVTKQDVNLPKDETLHIKFRYNDYFSKSIYAYDDFRFTQDSLGTDVIYSNDIAFYVLKTDESKPFIQIEKISNGRTSTEARKRAEKIKYNFDYKGNTLTLDNYFLTDLGNKYRNQKVEIYLYLPENTVFQCDESVKHYDNSDNGFFDLMWDDTSEQIYMMEANKVQCLTCPQDDEVEIDVPDAPAAPGTADIKFNARGNGEIHVTDENEDVKVHMSIDSLSIKSKRKNN
jgi:hypothetical protein